jgi:hypothetical protein
MIHNYCRKGILLILSMCLPSLSFALFCPRNFIQINAGDSIEKVTQLCGKPDSQKESTTSNESEPQEWSYYVPQPVFMDGSTQNAQGSLKTQMTFDKDGKAINISVNGIGVGSTTICGGKTVQIGDSRDTVKAACGQPSFINKQAADPAAPPVAGIKTTTFIYNTNPPVKLVFKDGKLVGNE